MAPKIIQTDMPFPTFSMEADTDYLLARLVNFSGAGFHSRAGFFAQQACEKYMKALMLQHDGSYLETHKLIDLAARCEKQYGSFFSEKETLRVLSSFDMFDQVGRYGGMANFDPLSKGGSAGGFSVKIGPGVRIAGASIWTGKQIDDLDSFVFKARGFLDFPKIKWGDDLKAILENDPKGSLHLSAWRLPIPLRQVLTVENAYFRA
ncbi:HEPN domain-containing protein [Bradyrhizobium sp.]